jgi:hypothetical protein
MSRQLHISGLFSALAMVALCMVVAVQDLNASDAEPAEALVQAEVTSGLQS